MVGLFIKNRRMSLKLSQRKLAESCEPPVSVQFISNVERGLTPIPAQHISALARILQLSTEQILDEMGKEFISRLKSEIENSEKNRFDLKVTLKAS